MTPSRIPERLSPDCRLEVAARRPRETAPPPTPFRDLLAGGVSVLMSGAEVATHVVGGPILAAAVHDARVGATTALAERPPLTGAPPGTGAPAGTVTGAGTTSAPVESMVQAGQASNLQLLALQEQIQQENQWFSTISNVLRAKHDTAKAAVANIRA